MNTAALLVASVAAFFGMVEVVSVAVGVATLWLYSRRNRQLHDIYAPRIGTEISVVVCGVQSGDEIRRRLTTVYEAYELIVVGDFAGAPDTDETLHAYRMVRMSFVDREMHLCGRIDIYRSRQRRYRRLILVDRPESDPDDCRRCAAAVASFERIAFLGADTFLDPDALQTLGAAAEMFPDRRIRGLASPPLPSDPTQAIVWAVGLALENVGLRPTERVELVGREAFVTGGALCSNRNIWVGRIATTRRTGSDSAAGSRRTMRITATLWLLLAGVAAAVGNRGAFELLTLAAVSLYAASFASAAMALVAVKHDAAAGILKITPKTLFLYPFRHVIHTIIGYGFRFNEKSR